MNISSFFDTYICNKYFIKNYMKYIKNSSFLISSARNMVNIANESSYHDFSKPEEPKDEDCCHSGCQNCVFDVYVKALEQWKTSTKAVNPTLRYDLLSVTQFKPFVLIDIKQLCRDTNLYTFKPYLESPSSLSGFLPYNTSQYLALRVDKCPDSVHDQLTSHLIRDFTLISLPQDKTDCSFEILVKLYESSVTSSFIKSLKLGDKTYWRGPYGDFKYNSNTYSSLIMFCMGTGIAPMYALIKDIIRNEADETLVSLHFGCRRNSDIIFRDEIKHLMSYWNFNCTYYLSEEKDVNSKKYCENFVHSRINLEHVKKAIANKKNMFVLVCGSSEFCDDIKIILKTLNIDECQFYIF